MIDFLDETKEGYSLTQGAENRDKYVCDANYVWLTAADYAGTILQTTEYFVATMMKHHCLALLAPLLMRAGAVEAVECVPIQSSSSKSVWTFATPIMKAGKYCLKQNLRGPRVHSLGAERAYPSGGLQNVHTDNVDIDLGGHRLDAEANGMSGLWLGSQYERPPRGISVRHGSIASRTGSAIALHKLTGTVMSDFRAVYKDNASVRFTHGEFAERQPGSAEDYATAGFVMEDVRLEANKKSDGKPCVTCYGVGLIGKANVIRNSRIDIWNGQAAILLLGPGSIIENNIIVFHGQAAVQAAGVIKLYQADNTIIRNNDIVIEAVSDGDFPLPAIFLTDSKNVILEGNRFYGVKTVSTIDEQSSYSVNRDNKSVSEIEAHFLK